MREIARALIETGAVLIRPDEPFTLASGRKSPVYVDCRRLISFPDVVKRVTRAFARIAEERIRLQGFEVIAGGETAGIPFAAFLAYELGKPMIYVRKAPKDHGRGSQIEGVLEEGQRVVLVEDLVTDGGSKLAFIEGIERAGGRVEHCLCVFEYHSRRAGLRVARERLARRGVRLHSLTNWDEVLELGLAEGRLPQRDVDRVLVFLESLKAQA